MTRIFIFFYFDTFSDEYVLAISVTSYPLLFFILFSGVYECSIVQHTHQPSQCLPLGHQWIDGGLGVHQESTAVPAAGGGGLGTLLHWIQ